MSAPHFSVVIPVYGNEATLDELLERLTAVMESLGRSFEVVAVDDGSRDGSLALLRPARRGRPAAARARAARNGGQSALCAGFDHVRGRFVVCLDADLENLPEDVPALVAPLETGADLLRRARPRWILAASPAALGADERHVRSRPRAA